MNIEERKKMLSQHAEIETFGGKKCKKDSMDPILYFQKLQRPPLFSYVPQWVVQQLYGIINSARLINNVQKRFKLQNELLAPWGFKPLASGTNRRAFYCTYDPSLVLKIASDSVGQSDNKSEYLIQHSLMPFCPKVFDVVFDGTAAICERVEVMTEDDYKLIWTNEIFDMFFSLLNRGFIFEDVGSNFYKNLGIRIGFGPVILDFPYMYKLDWRKLSCIRRDPITREVCGGEIDYDYDKGMSEIICTKCGTRYSAKYLASMMPGEVFSPVIKRREIVMRSNIDTNIRVRVTKGGKTVFEPGRESKTIPANAVATQQTQTVSVAKPEEFKPVPNYAINYPSQQPQQIPQQYYDTFWTDQSQVQQPVMTPSNRVAVVEPNVVAQAFSNQQQQSYIPQQPAQPSNFYQANVQRQTIILPNNKKTTTVTPEEAIALMAEYRAKGQKPPTEVTKLPQIRPGMMQNQQAPQHVNPIETVGPIKEYEHYYKNGVRYFYYPKNLKNDIIHWLRRIEGAYGIDIAQMFAKRLELEYIPKQTWDDSRTPKAPEPNQAAKTIVINPQPVQSGYQTINTVNRPAPVQTIIAPQPPQRQLRVEDPNFYKDYPSRFTSQNQVQEQPVQQENRQTTGLQIMKPKTAEEIEAEETKNRADGAILGYPGVAAVDTARFKVDMPKIKTMVEQRFNNFQMSPDAEQQAYQLSQDIAHFIAEDVQRIMNDDGKGLFVSATRTVDHLNKDCYVITASNYGSPLFNTTLYPAAQVEVQQTITQTNTEEDGMKISVQELVKYFESKIGEFDPTRYDNQETTRKGLIAFLGQEAYQHFGDDILFARAMNEAGAYVDTAVNFATEPKSISAMDSKQATQPQQPVQQQATIANSI